MAPVRTAALGLCTLALALGAGAQPPVTTTPTQVPDANPDRRDVPPTPPVPPAPPTRYVPTPADIQSAVIKRLGGRAAIEALGARVAKGAVEVRMNTGGGTPPATVATGTIVIQIAKGSKALMVTELVTADGKPSGKIVQGSNGAVAWSIDPASGVRLLPEPERAAFLESVALDAELTLLDRYPNTLVHADEMLGQRAVLRVEHSTRDAKGPTRYIDRGNARVLRVDLPVAAPGGAVLTVETEFDDYRKVGEVLVPFRITSRRGPLEQIVRLTECSHPASLPAETFALPPEIAALLGSETKPKDDPAATAKPPSPDAAPKP